MNGALNLISGMGMWFSAGGPVTYDAAFATAIGGYPAGTLLSNAALTGFWHNTVDNNTTNPDAGGTGWALAFPGRLITMRVFGTSGVFPYTPTTNTSSIVVEVQGAGGAGGGSAATSASQVSAGAGGGGGGYALKRITSGFSGASMTVGLGGQSAGIGFAGNNGNASSFGAFCSAAGGQGGTLGPSRTPDGAPQGNGPGGVGSGGDITAEGEYGRYAVYNSFATSGGGGASHFGGGAPPITTSANGLAAQSPGAGGAGGVQSVASAPGSAGGAGGNGLILVWEFT